MPQIVINRCFGSFCLSDEAIELFVKLKGIHINQMNDNFTRDDPILVKVVQDLGSRANGEGSKLKIVEIPDDVDWCIEEYDGVEHIAERHRTWK